MPEQLQFKVPWQQIVDLWPSILKRERYDLERFVEGVVSIMSPPPHFENLAKLPNETKFLLCANHYQRRGMWILHPASAITIAMRQRYGPENPPMRWVVTANWPPWQIGPWKFPSPGDILLPRVAHALWCYPVSFAGFNPAYTARSIRQILRDAPKLTRPIGLFPEGVAGVAGKIGPPLKGVDRLIAMLAHQGLPVVPAGIREEDRLIIRFGDPIAPAELLQANNPALIIMDTINELVSNAKKLSNSG